MSWASEFQLNSLGYRNRKPHALLGLGLPALGPQEQLGKRSAPCVPCTTGPQQGFQDPQERQLAGPFLWSTPTLLLHKTAHDLKHLVFPTGRPSPWLTLRTVLKRTATAKLSCSSASDKSLWAQRETWSVPDKAGACPCVVCFLFLPLPTLPFIPSVYLLPSSSLSTHYPYLLPGFIFCSFSYSDSRVA